MTRPSLVKVLGKAYSIEWVHPRDIGDDYGECRSHECLIKVSTEQAEIQQRDALLHEIVHAVDFEMDTKLTERAVRLIATGLLNMLRDNPLITTWLTDG